MKSIYILSTMVLLLALQTTFAQVDRSKKPLAGPAPVIKIGDPQQADLPNGIKILLVENHKVPKVSVSYQINRDAILEGDKAGIISMLDAMMGEGTTKMSKEVFDEEVDKIGASVNASSGNAYASALTKNFPRAVELMSQALLSPALPADALEKNRKQAITGFKSNEKNVKAIAGRVQTALNYGKNTAYGEFETEETLKNITLDDVKAAYKKYVTPNKGYLIFVGDITLVNAKAIATKYFGNWKSTAIINNEAMPPTTLNEAEINIVDVPNAVQTNIIVTRTLDNRKTGSDFFPLILANQILGGGADARLFMNLREKHGFTYGSYSNVGNNKLTGMANMSATAEVRTEVTDSAVMEIVNELKRMGTEKASATEIQNIKNLINGSFALGTENESRIVDFAYNIYTENLPKDFYRNYLQKMNAVTADQIIAVSKKHFDINKMRILLVGNAKGFLDKIKTLGYKINYFDKYANPTTAPGIAVAPTPTLSGTTTSTAAVTGLAVIQKYLTAIGGKDALAKITTMTSDGEMAVMGRTASYGTKETNSGKSLSEIKVGSMTVMKDVFNGTKGSRAQGPQSMEYTEKEIKESKAEPQIFDELDYSKEGFKVELIGTEKIDGDNCYKLEITTPAGNKKTEYYSEKTGYHVRSEKEDGQILNYKDYKDFNGIKLPSIIEVDLGMQQFEIKIKNYKFNEVISDSIFE